MTFCTFVEAHLKELSAKIWKPFDKFKSGSPFSLPFLAGQVQNTLKASVLWYIF